MKLIFCAMFVSVGYTATVMAQPPEGDNYGPPPGGLAGPPPNAMFDAIDVDGDGAITMRELRKAVAALKQLDANQDGKITLAEATLAQNGLRGSVAPGGFRGATGFGNGPIGGDPRPGGANIMKYDRNGDGQLSADEVPTNLRGMLRGSDRNGNGTLDAQELQAIEQRMNERARGQRPLPPGVSVGPQGAERTPQKP